MRRSGKEGGLVMPRLVTIPQDQRGDPCDMAWCTKPAIRSIVEEDGSILGDYCADCAVEAMGVERE